MSIIKTIISLLLYMFVSFCLQIRHFTQKPPNLSSSSALCTQQQSSIISLNNHCQLQYSSCLQQPQHITKISTCLYCQQQSLQFCPYLQYLPEVECIQKCCPYSEYFLAGLQKDRLGSCIQFTNMQRNNYDSNINNTNGWIHDRVMFPVLIVVVVLLVVTFVILLVKTVMHLWMLYGNWDKRENQDNQNNSNTTQAHEEIPEWVYY